VNRLYAELLDGGEVHKQKGGGEERGGAGRF